MFKFGAAVGSLAVLLAVRSGVSTFALEMIWGSMVILYMTGCLLTAGIERWSKRRLYRGTIHSELVKGEYFHSIAIRLDGYSDVPMTFEVWDDLANSLSCIPELTGYKVTFLGDKDLCPKSGLLPRLWKVRTLGVFSFKQQLQWLETKTPIETI